MYIVREILNCKPGKVRRDRRWVLPDGANGDPQGIHPEADGGVSRVGPAWATRGLSSRGL